MNDMTERHDGVLDGLARIRLEVQTHTARINRTLGDSYLRPDLVVTSTDLITIIDDIIPFDVPDNIGATHGGNFFLSWALSGHGSRPTNTSWPSWA